MHSSSLLDNEKNLYTASFSIDIQKLYTLPVLTCYILGKKIYTLSVLTPYIEKKKENP